MNSSSAPDALFERNLRCLALKSPRLAERLCEPVAGEHVEILAAKTGAATARFNQIPELWIQAPDDPRADAEKTVAGWQCRHTGPVLCLGVGLGYELQILRERLLPDQRIIGYERDPWLLRQAMRCHDFSADILSGRLSFLLGTDLAEVPNSGPFSLFQHPMLSSLYQSEYDYLQAHAEAKALRRAMLVSGGLFVADVADALRDLGFNVLLWDPRRVSRAESIHQLQRFEPELVFAVNYLAGLPELCRNLGLPCVIWEIDPCIERLPAGRFHSETTCIYTYRKGHVERYRSAGFANVEYLPLAANPKRRRPVLVRDEDRNRYGTEVSFVGSSMQGQAHALKKVFLEACRYPDAAVAEKLWQEALDRQREDADRATFRSVLSQALGVGNLVSQDKQGRWVDLGDCVGEAAASERRCRIVNFLAAQGFKVAVWGDPGWQENCPNIDYRGWAGHDAELTKIYNAAQINLDINRLYQNDIVTMRVFDVLACQGFLLAEDSSDLHSLFRVGSEVVAYRSEADLRRLIRHYLSHGDERRQMAEAGHARVLRDHTIQQRVATILEGL